VLLHEAGGLHEHAAGTAGRVEDAPVEGFDDLDDQLDDAGGGVELAALLPLGHGELAEEVLVDPAEGVALDVHGDGAHQLEQLHQGGVLQPVVGLRQHVLEVGILLLDGAHGAVDRPTDVLPLRQLEQVAESRRFGQIEHAHGLVPLLVARTAAATTALLADSLFGLGELHIRIAQEDHPQHRDGVFRRLQLGVGPQLVGGAP